MIAEKIRSLAYGVVRVVGAGIFFYLAYYSLRYSQYIFPQKREFPIDMKGLPAQSILAAALLGIGVFLLLWLEKKGTEQVRLWVERIVLVISLLWVACFSFWWISALERQPGGDQAFIYGGASYFMEGMYSFLGKGGYCDIYPHQLGLIAYVEALFLVFGAYNYYAYQVMNAIMAVGIAFLGYCLLREFAAPFGARILYCLLMMGCIPLVAYTSWVYGDVPSIFFAMLAAWFAARWENDQKKSYLAGLVVSCVMAMLVRKNSLILLVALCLLAAVAAICDRKKWQIGVTALLALVCAFLAYQGIYKMYEVRSGYEHSSGLPTNSWILMGLLEQESNCGWYNNIVKDMAGLLDYDYGKMKEEVDVSIEERLDAFKADPEYARTFFKKKILSQWNDPLCQSIYFSANDQANHPAKPGSFLEKLYYVPEVHDRVFRFADVVQFLVYLGMLFYFLFAIRREISPLACLLAVTIIGGFFFSILWEAKARYIFPYYVMMYPLAAAGYFAAAKWGIAQSLHFTRFFKPKNRNNTQK